MPAQSGWHLLSTLLCAVTLGCLSDPAVAQTIKFEHLTIDDGLSQGSVEHIVQDEHGFVWFCTRDGLNRYDGRGFKVFKHERDDASSISNNFVRQMVAGRDGEYWIATKYGLNRFYADTETFETFLHDPADTSSLSSNNVMRVLLDHTGTLWVGTWGGGLNSIDSEDTAFRRYAVELNDAQFARGNIINSICETRDGTLWVAAITGLYSSPPDRGSFILHELADDYYPGERENIVVCIYEGEDGTVWLGTYSGLIRYDLGSGIKQRFPLDPSDPKNTAANQIRFITPAPDNSADTLWMCTATQGLVVFDIKSGGMTRHQHDASNPLSIAHNSLWSSYQDNSGTVWIGTAGRGVNKITPMSARFEHINQETVNDEGLNSNSIWSFCEDGAGNLWLGTSRGLSLYESKNDAWRSVTHVAGDVTSIGDGPVYSMLADRTGAIWFATGSSGLSRLPGPDENGSYTTLEFEHFHSDASDSTSISADRLFSLFEDRDGRIWVGTVDEGVDVHTPGTVGFEHYRPDKNNANSISDNGVECIYQDDSGDYWFGTLAGGLNRLDPKTGTFRHYKHDAEDPASLSSNHVTSTVEDAHSNLWVATADGLNRIGPGRDEIEHFFESDGLPNSYVYGLVRDDIGGLWMSTNLGLARFDLETESFRSFTTRDGLQSNEFNAGAFYRSSQGEIFVGGHNGFNRFFPGTIHDNPNIPPVVLTSFQVLGEPAPLARAIFATDAIELSHRDYFFSFEFASLDYWAPERNQYQHMMEGLDTDWINDGHRNFVTYTHLDPGQYVLRVRASNSDGVWNSAGVSIPIRITPPFWKRLWFLGLVALMVALVIYGLHRYRVRRLLEIERLRTRISADLHDEIATNLSSIAMFSGMIEEEGASDDRSHASQLQTRIRELAEESVGSIRDIIWAINPTTETLHDLLLRLRDRLVVACRSRDIVLQFDHPGVEVLPSRNLAPEKRQHLWLLLKEAVNNAVKHSKGSQLALRAEYAEGILTATISDNGVGFDASQPSDGSGLTTMRMRARHLGGRVAIESAVGDGTRIKVTVPI